MTYINLPKYQRTLKDKISLIGLEALGGNDKLEVDFLPAPPNTGIVCESPDGQRVPVSLEHAHFKKNKLLRTIAIKKDGMEVMHIEHGPPIMKYMGIDNAIIKFRQNLFDNTFIMPNFPKNEVSLCEAIKKTGLKIQAHNRRKYFTLISKKILKGRNVTLQPIDENELQVEVHIDYIQYGGEDGLIFHIDPSQEAEYSYRLARARSYAGSSEVSKLSLEEAQEIARKANYKFGQSHGFTLEHYLWVAKNQEEMKKLQNEAGFENGEEILFHGVKDKLGAITLLENQLGGRIIRVRYISDQSGHEDDIEFEKRIYKEGHFIEL